MQELISLYMEKIAVYMIFTIFINIILPENSYKKHIYFVLGIVIIINIIFPITKISSNIEEYKLDIDKINTINQINYNSYTSQDIILSQFNKEFEQVLMDYPQISHAQVTSQIQDNCLYVTDIQLACNDKNIIHTIAKKYNIPLNSIHITGDED